MTDAQLRADKAYKSKTKTITVRFKPDEIDLYDKVIKLSGNDHAFRKTNPQRIYRPAIAGLIFYAHCTHFVHNE